VFGYYWDFEVGEVSGRKIIFFPETRFKSFGEQKLKKK
jgi:hypothetical protein